VLSFLRFFADDHHQAKEEAVLFPALLQASHAEEHPRLCKMTFEHNQQRSLVEGIEDALRTRKGADFVYYAQKLVDIVRRHITDEDDVLFKLADGLLSPEEDERVAREIAEFDGPLRKKALIPLLEALVALELKYNCSAPVREGAAHV
jgi:hemerythrin-like domain-containing protein